MLVAATVEYVVEIRGSSPKLIYEYGSNPRDSALGLDRDQAMKFGFSTKRLMQLNVKVVTACLMGGIQTMDSTCTFVCCLMVML